MKRSLDFRTAALAFAVALAGAAHGQQLNAYWTADGTTADSSGNGNTGILENGATYGSGKYGQAFSLNGAGQFVQVNSPSFYLGASSFTVSVWANFASLNNSGYGQLPNTLIAQDEGGGTTSKWALFYDSSANSLGFHVNGPGSSSNFYLQSIGALTTVNNWNMFTVTESGTSMSFYADGQLLGTSSGVVLPTSVSAPITIGEAEGIGYVNGSLDDIRIYGSALSSSQVNSLYNTQATPEVPPVLILGVGSLGLLLRKRRSLTG